MRHRLDWFALWLAMFGVWPFADPGHHASESGLATLDVAFHVAASAFLIARWKPVRR